MATGQKASIADKNAAFFDGNAGYADAVETLTTYRNIRRSIDREVAGIDRLLDIGNGGVFDYDVGLVKEIVGVDLFLDDGRPTDLPAHVTLRRGDALALDEPSASYDAVLLALVFHHLTGASADSVEENARRAVAEAHRVLKPGGKLIVVESCVPRWFYSLERVAFLPLVLLSERTSIIGDHPPTLQLPLAELERLVSRRFVVERTERVAVGRWILQFGRRWPTRLTPARPWILTASARPAV